MNSLYLQERLALATSLIAQRKTKSPESSDLLNRWMQQPPFRNKPEWLGEKLKAEKVSKEAFLTLVNTSDLQQTSPSAPLQTLTEGWRNRWLDETNQAEYEPFLMVKYPEICFLNLCLPITTAAQKAVASVLTQCATTASHLLPEVEKTAKMLKANLFDQLLPKLRKTLIIEINHFKDSGQLTADTPEGRFLNYIHLLNTTAGRTHFLDKYPVLVRQLIEATDNWQQQSINVVQRLANDYDVICQQILKQSPKEVGALKTLQFGAGDVHRGGQTVAIATFENGSKIVYKPRSLAIDEHFQSLLSWVNGKTDLTLAQLSILNQKDYGWVEFVAHTSCTSEQETLDYYYRVGGYLAILYTLEATDFHYENIIACGSQPYLIDLESFFHPYFTISGMETNQSMDSTVLRTGLLPVEIGGSEDSDGLDISGLTDVEGKKTVVKISTIKNAGTDEAHLERAFIELPGAKNIPLLNGQKLKMTAEFQAQIKRGFSTVYRAFAQNRQELTEPKTGLLARFQEDEIRVLFRDTMVYSHLMEESYHPQIQANGLELDRHFDWLWAVAPSFELIKHVIPYEKASMLKGDVPLFSARVGDKHLWVDHDTKIENFFQETGIDLVTRRLNSLNEKDLERQCWIIDACLQAQLSSPTQAEQPKKEIQKDVQQLSTPATREDLLAAAQKVGDYLEQYAFKGTEAAEWMTLRLGEGDKVKITPMTYDLFSGLPGEILFLAHLGAVSGEKRYTQLAEKALNSLKANIQYGKEGIRPLGLYAGWGSIFHVFTTLAQKWNRPDLNDYSSDLFETVNFDELIRVDTSYGIVKGLAGFIVAMLNHHEATGHPTSKTLAIKAGEQLSLKATSQERGIGWKITSAAPLAGYSHGASGICVAFNRLYLATQEERYLPIIKGALQYEQSLYITEENNWQDLRDVTTSHFPGQKVCATGWAHGAPGIALARVELLKNPALKNTAQLQQELNTALATTALKGMKANHTLSMGAFGSLGALYDCSLATKNDALQHESLVIANKLLASIDQHGWICALPNGLTSPGLMTGVTGIGYQCLRMAAPTQVPSVLSIQPNV